MSSSDGKLLSSLASAWLADPRGKILLTGWACTVAGVTVRAVLQRRQKRKATRDADAAKKKDDDAPAPPSSNKPPATTPTTTAAGKPKGKAPSPIRALIKLAMPTWGAEPMMWGCALSVGIAIRLVVQIKVSAEIGTMGSLLAQRRWPELFQRQLGYALYGLPAALLAAFQKYASTNLALGLRCKLMAKVHAGLGRTSSLPTVYARASPAGDAPSVNAAAGAKADKEDKDSPVQLATADVSAFSSEAVLLFEALFKPFCEVCLSSYSLGSMMGLGPLVQCYSYFLIAGSWTRFCSPSFATMTERVQQAEGTLLDAHTRVHAYAEEVSMMHGAPAEAIGLDADLASLRAASSHLSLQRFLAESLDGYVLRYLGILSAFTAMLPAVYHGVGARANEDPTEYFLTCLHLLVNVGLALRDLVGSFKVAATARGYATRVQTLYDALDAVPAAAAAAASHPQSSSSTPTPSPVLVLDKLTVQAPDGGGTALIDELSLTLKPGQRLMLRGPNGSGKSSLLRVLGGVWAPASGRVVTMPPAADVAFVTQRPYVPAHLSLRALLAYPHPVSAGAAAGVADDASVLAVLKWAGLDGVASKLGGIDVPVGSLSGGEMQRVGLARLRLRPPALAVLDEATANLESAFEAKVFEWAAASGLTLVTVAHTQGLRVHHTHELLLHEGGKCTVSPV